ncbi:polysaccharide pyruvyl transferase family protein [Roseomonas sp. SSH11]|uniref:Polysaccharide pyruvyl transferase family protein n=1 Tax=Pararoseomonas baculiformis TaxID=2820812 RepID=A0ABS4ADI3_9PROT|nr:polysaccharide pyruvyl transferase family protein [Pararoseomonas baculiformis]MBP0445062.1 polysaccharide pyruvyl transferase family protein [Pararoseomonas baculiformis]
MGSQVRRVAMAGMFDIANYGDQLFPLIARHRLAPHGIEVVPAAPGDRPRVLADAIRPRSLEWLLADPEPVDGILIGGGNIIYNLRTDYLGLGGAAGWLGDGLHTATWLAATMAALLRDVPLAWNAPGVPYPFSTPTAAAVLQPALRATDYVSVRDNASAALLAGAEVAVVPDTVAELASLWPLAALHSARQALSARGRLPAGPYLALHLRAARKKHDRLPALARELDAFLSAQGLGAVLVAIGDDLGDGETLRALAASMATRPAVLDDAATLQEIAAAIAHSVLYVGGSLHGYVTAAAYGIPGVIVTGAPQRKFGGFLEWLDRPADIARDWDAGLARARHHLAGPGSAPVPARVHQALDEHWDRIRKVLENPASRRPMREGLLRHLAGRAMARPGGQDWAMRPWTCFAARRPRLAGGSAA